MIAGSLFWYVFFAALGAFVVLLGLLMEQYSEQHLPKNIIDFRFSKCVKFFGEWFVIFGVFTELVVGVISAIDAWQDAPQNQPIASISAKIDFLVQGTNSPTLPLLGQLAVGTPEAEKRGTHTLYPIFDSDFKWVTFKNSKTLWFLECEEMPQTASFSGERVRDADKWTVFEIQVPFLTAGTEIIGGKVVLNINSILKTNVIPP